MNAIISFIEDNALVIFVICGMMAEFILGCLVFIERLNINKWVSIIIGVIAFLVLIGYGFIAYNL